MNKISLRNILIASIFINCNLVLAQTSNKNAPKEVCPQLLELIKDPAFISKVSSENGMTSMRFYSVEIPLQKEMLIRYGERHGICESKNK
jgi:hypothetical protein